jgi:hypothetical protein
MSRARSSAMSWRGARCCCEDESRGEGAGWEREEVAAGGAEEEAAAGAEGGRVGDGRRGKRCGAGGAGPRGSGGAGGRRGSAQVARAEEAAGGAVEAVGEQRKVAAAAVGREEKKRN